MIEIEVGLNVSIAVEQPQSFAGRGLYRIFGLTVASDLPLPEATAIAPSELVSADVDVRIELAEAPLVLPAGRRLASWMEVDGASCLFDFRDIGRFLIERGRRVVVEKHPDASFDDLRGYLFGSVFGAVAHQRGLVPLHVSALATPVGGVAFTGESGAGKSTLAATLNQELGWPLICDDVAVLYADEDEYHLKSGLNTVRLWKDALYVLNRSSEGLRRDLMRHDKYHAIQSESFFGGSIALKRLVILEWGDDVSMKRVTGRLAYQAVLGSIYRPEFMSPFSNRKSVVMTVMSLAHRIEVWRLERPKNHLLRANIVKQLAAALSCAP